MNKYNPTIGYANLSDINKEKASHTALYAKKILDFKVPNIQIEKILIAGCGDGTEAILLQELFDKYVYGIDISLEKELDIPNKITLKNGDLMKLSLPLQSFDFIYSYHVLEHVPEPEVVLQSLSEVLKEDGVIFIGFPNKNRLLGYMGTHNNVSLTDIIKWNLRDYQDRLRGKFENKYGAHAGFSNNEFHTMTKGIFKTIIPVRNDYMILKYAKYQKIIKLLIFLGLSGVLFPSNYYILKK